MMLKFKIGDSMTFARFFASGGMLLTVIAITIAVMACGSDGTTTAPVTGNTGNEIQKSGINIDYASDFVNYCTLDLKLNIIGLMCLPPFDEDPKKHFMLLNDIANKNNLKHLSMGMSADYKIALNCGASFIRIGSTLFGERK